LECRNRDGGKRQELLLKYANRHGLIAGATGTGKTVTLQILAESFSANGVPVFLSDVKGDLSGLGGERQRRASSCTAPSPKRAGRSASTDYAYRAFPVTFWDLFGEQGHPVRTTVSEMGPLLLARLLELTEAQEGVLNIAFRVADEQGLPLLDLKDLQALLVWVGENRDELGLRYGNVAPASVGAIQRAASGAGGAGGRAALREPALALDDLMATDDGGRADQHPAADTLMQLAPALRDLPAVAPVGTVRGASRGGRSRQAEARLLLRRGASALRRRAQGAGRQGGAGGPPDPLQGRRGLFRHAEPRRRARGYPRPARQPGAARAPRLHRARTSKDLRRARRTYRTNPVFDIEDAIREVGVGEAVTSMLEAKGAPGVAERTLIRPPSSQLGPIAPATRAALMGMSPLAGKYDTAVDRESAFEVLRARAEEAAREAEEAERAEAEAEEKEREFKAARR
jgi:DNA helicase HerA-like ATPase